MSRVPVLVACLACLAVACSWSEMHAFVNLLRLMWVCSTAPCDGDPMHSYFAQRCVQSHHMLHDTAALPWSADMRAAASTMRDEYETFVSSCRVPLFDANLHFQDVRGNEALHARYNESSVWGTLWLKVWGHETDLGRRHFPRSLEAVRRSPLSTAMISVLEPHKGVTWHKGYFSGVLRYHVGIIVPPDEPDGTGPRLSVVDSKRGGPVVEVPWREGADLLFDDTFNHSVRNPTAAQRVVLFADVVRLDCPPLLHSFLWLLSHHVLHRVQPQIAGIAAGADLSIRCGERSRAP